MLSRLLGSERSFSPEAQRPQEGGFPCPSLGTSGCTCPLAHVYSASHTRAPRHRRPGTPRTSTLLVRHGPHPQRKRLPEDQDTTTPKSLASGTRSGWHRATCKRSQRTSGGESELLCAWAETSQGRGPPGHLVPLLCMVYVSRGRPPDDPGPPPVYRKRGKPRPRDQRLEEGGEPLPGGGSHSGRGADAPRPSAAPEPAVAPAPPDPLAGPVWQRRVRISKPRGLAANGPAPSRPFPQPLPPPPLAPPLAAPT